jgi:hypothetical protein
MPITPLDERGDSGHPLLDLGHGIGVGDPDAISPTPQTKPEYEGNLPGHLLASDHLPRRPLKG